MFAFLMFCRANLVERYRALFVLRNLADDRAVHWMAKCFDDTSALLKHEVAYCLGQTNNLTALPILKTVLQDENQEIIVRHEAAEALGAIGDESSVAILQKYAYDKQQELLETCQLALKRIEWRLEQKAIGKDFIDRSPYNSIDPAPAAEENDVELLGQLLLNPTKSLWERYRAMFALRNINTDKSIATLAKGLQCKDSALFRHEVAYALGQVASNVAFEQLRLGLENIDENPMVRHECAEALGSIGSPDCEALLTKFLCDKEHVVRESCVVALDIAEYRNSDDIGYIVDSTAESPS
ncbi:unnamed protein product [Dracunculus medinensis]|uniref:Deoxyhypusine hydroxylase n=1 Tax=Dracunculus medinensis TaxID=318479 RepID=A0A0N4U2H9_DRAME|nr:unnamed protein product [Dracunculus medinensis]